MLGNANARLNVWRQRRFSDFLTDLGKRTLREGIPTDKHLFPHQFHEKIKSEHDHKASTSKLVCKPKEGRKPWASSQSFRDSATYRRDQQGGGDQKRKWAGYRPRGSNAKYSKTGGGARRASDSNQAASNNLSQLSALYLSPYTFGQTNGKQTRNFLANWKLITTDRWVLHAVSGYKIPFLSPPYQWRWQLTKKRYQAPWRAWSH